MATLVVVGTQWGDEGKGKITDFLAERAEVVARYQGGDNAGHTVYINGIQYKLHLIPSGIFFKDKLCVIGNGMVINPASLLRELDYLAKKGVSTENLVISNRAHLILPYHIRLDQVQEMSKGSNKIGTTGKGIGPAYMDKAARSGIRVADLLEPEEFRVQLERNLKEKNHLLERVYSAEGFELESIFNEYMGYAERLAPYVVDTSVVLNEAIDEGKRVLFEGAQGVMLDIDQGTYPFVTSSNPVAGGVAIGSGVGPNKIEQVLGVAKAYMSRVGDGPFPTELHDAIGDRIREVGKEYGTTTGRPRRIGWFDSVVVRHARRVSGLTGLSLNSLDVLTGIETLRICTSYELDGEIVEVFPASLRQLARCKPLYEEWPGWEEDISSVRRLEDLPANARRYLERVSELTRIPLVTFSVGPNREQTNMVKDLFAL